jgi:hypothetical protein
MNILKKTLLYFLFLLSPFLSLSGTTINGYIYGEDNIELEGVEISFLQNNEILYTTTSDSAGKFDLDIVSGTYSIRLYQEEYALFIASNTYTKDFQVNYFTMSQGIGTIVGKVIDNISGAPIEGTAVKLFLKDILAFSTITDENGNYATPLLSPNLYSLKLSAQNYQNHYLDVEVKDSIVTRQIAIKPKAGNISGKVTSSHDGEAIIGALITATFHKTAVTVASDAYGEYTLTGLGDHRYNITITAPHYQDTSTSLDVTTGESTPLNIYMKTEPEPIIKAEPEPVIEKVKIAEDVDPLFSKSIEKIQSNIVYGTISDTITQGPIAGSIVKASNSDNTFTEYAVTGSDGSYNLRGLYEDTFVIEVTKSGYMAKKTSSFGITGSNQTLTKDLSLVSENPITQNLKGTVLVNRSLLQEDWIHIIEWGPSLSLEVASYKVYRNGNLVKIVPLTGSLVYEDHNRNPSTPDMYRVTSINSNGSESSGRSISLQ